MPARRQRCPLGTKIMSELKRLREKYGSAAGSEIFDPAFKAVAAAQFSGERRKLPYADVATFLDLPYLAEGIAAGAFKNLDLAIARRQLADSHGVGRMGGHSDLPLRLMRMIR